MWWDVLRLALGAALLYAGAEWLVKGAAGLARSLGMRPLVIGLTVVAYGTSAPEMVVTLLAAVEGRSAIALGNVVGSNVANLGMILGVTALISPPRVDGALIRREIPFLVASALVVPAVLADGRIGRVEGVALVAAALAFTWLTLRTAARVPPRSELGREASEEAKEEALRGSVPVLSGLVAAGLLLLVGGGKVLVDGAVGLAATFGISERVVGLTIVAVGTSLPELAASTVAALRGHASIAVGNVVGSNIFNVLLILGASAAVRPVESPLSAVAPDVAAMVALTLVAAVLLRAERTIRRAEGGLLLATYAAFMVWVAVG